MTTKLPTFKGYTVDVRLKEFRMAQLDSGLKFISFQSPKGESLLEALIDSLDPNTPEGRKMLIDIWA